jgi:hypothetical protein
MTIVDTGQSRHYALQRGPDNRIYVVGPEANYLDVIDSPNVAGVGCAYRARGVYLGSNASTVRGLPNTISNDRPAELCPMRVDDASAFGLRGVFSNTVLSETRIRFWTALPGRVRIDIQDMLGRSRAVVLDQYMINTAEQEIYLDDQELESGVFIVRLIYEGNAVSQPFVLVR